MKQYINCKTWDQLNNLEKENVNEALLTVNGDNLGRTNSKLYFVVKETDTEIINEWYIETMYKTFLTKILITSDWEEVIDYKNILLGRF